MDLSKMSSFYRNLFKLWSLFRFQKVESSHSLYWLLEEPLILGARLDVSDSCNLHGLSLALQKSGTTTLGQMLTLAGPNLENAEVTSLHLGINSVRVVSSFLGKLKAALTAEEDQMLKDYHSGESTPNAQDLFPCLKLLPNLEGCTGFFLKPWESLWFDLLSAKSKTLYSACVMAFNKKNLENKVDTPWRSFFGLDETVNLSGGPCISRLYLKD